MKKEDPIDVLWRGPFGWPGFESANGLPPIPKHPGIYLQTFEYLDGYLIYAAGITRRTIPKRFLEHTARYMGGDYNVLDVAAAQQGIRREIWHGWAYARGHRAEFEERKSTILEAVRSQLAAFRIFVTGTVEEPRLLQRLEASIMNNLYGQPAPICEIPDRGMQLAPRWDSEVPIVVRNNCAAVLHGLPGFLET